MSFSVDETDRYGRQALLAEWGAAGQERVRASHVGVLGHGIAAEAAVRYLAGAGVGGLAVEEERFVAIARAQNPHVRVDEPLPPLVAAHFNHRGAAPVVLLLPPPGVMIATLPRIEGAADRAAIGAACAVEALKALLVLPHQTRVTLDDEKGGP